jgi:2,4-dienoyl-CoA reductase-like NADH-dependent reductase (Old Yellow Enzyme family)
MPKISDPITIRNVELKNRLYAPPMITNVVREDCCAGKTLIDATYRRAKGGWSLVCSEGAVISETTKLFPRTLGIFDDIQVLALYDLV